MNNPADSIREAIRHARRFDQLAGRINFPPTMTAADKRAQMADAEAALAEAGICMKEARLALASWKPEVM